MFHSPAELKVRERSSTWKKITLLVLGDTDRENILYKHNLRAGNLSLVSVAHKVSQVSCEHRIHRTHAVMLTCADCQS